MIEQDTVRLLRECDSGAKMGIESLTGVIDKAENSDLQTILNQSKETHESLSREIRKELDRFEDQGKDPSPMGSAMSWLKSHAEMAMNASDETIADLMTDGCGMGIKSLSKYLNQYQAADETSKDLARRLISAEDELVRQLRAYL